jgi:regulatory protein
LKEIDGDEYIDILKKELEKKATKIKDTDPYIRKHKIAQYLNSRGFEQDLIWDLLGNE